MFQPENLKKGQKVAAIAFIIEGILVIGKIVIGLFSRSTVLISDAIHSASDLISIITSWFGLQISQKKANQRFPYGYYKAENLGTAIIAILILYAAYRMFHQGYKELFLVSSINIPFLALLISLIDAFVLYLFGNYEIKIGKQINAQSLIAMGRENKTHLISSLAVFVGILARIYQIPFLEGLITIIISLLILKIGIITLKDSIFSLMDVSPNKEVEEKVAQLISSVSSIEDFFDLRLRKAGPIIFGEVKVGVRKEIDLYQIHQITAQIEQKVKEKIPAMQSFMVRIVPFKSDYHHLVFPTSNKKDLNAILSDNFGRAPYFLFVNLKKDKVKGFYFLDNPHQKDKVKIGLKVAKLISKQKAEALIAKQVGEIAFNSLRENLFDIYQTDNSLVKDSIEKYLNHNLKKITKATKNV